MRHFPERLSSRNVVLSFQEDAIGIRLPPLAGASNWRRATSKA